MSILRTGFNMIYTCCVLLTTLLTPSRHTTGDSFQTLALAHHWVALSRTCEDCHHGLLNRGSEIFQPWRARGTRAFGYFRSRTEFAPTCTEYGTLMISFSPLFRQGINRLDTYGYGPWSWHIYRVFPGHSNWQIDTAAWNLASFLHFFQKPAGSELGSFLMIYRYSSDIKSLKKTSNLVKDQHKICLKIQHKIST